MTVQNILIADHDIMSLKLYMVSYTSSIEYLSDNMSVFD